MGKLRKDSGFREEDSGLSWDGIRAFVGFGLLWGGFWAFVKVAGFPVEDLGLSWGGFGRS